MELEIFSTILWVSGNNTLDGGGNDNLYGGNGADTLDGDGNDSFNGGSGIDQMSGGAGDDKYFVDNESDTVIENSSEGKYYIQ